MKKKTILMSLCAAAGLVLVFGCATASNAPRTMTGEKIRIAVLSDRGDPNAMEARQWQYRTEVGTYMERDLINRLNRTGYDARLIQSESEYVPAADSYLLITEIRKYNPGSSAARIVVGFGAGSCSLDMHYTVRNGAQVLQSWDDGIGTSMDWRRLAVALNDKLARKFNAELLTWK